MHEQLQTDANPAMTFVVATIVGIIAMAAAAAVYLAAAQRRQEEAVLQAARVSLVYEVKSDNSALCPRRHKNPLLDAVVPPAPQHRTSIDLLRRRYRTSDQRSPLSDQLSGNTCTDSGDAAGTATKENPDDAVAPHSPLDTLELDTDTVAALDCAGVNRILSCVPPDELEKHRLVLDSFNWDLDVLLETEIMTGITDE